MKKLFYLLLATIPIAFTAVGISADEVVPKEPADEVLQESGQNKMHVLFHGINIYGATILHDTQENQYKMWYMGWHNAGQKQDAIYYRISNDGGRTWGSETEYEAVLRPTADKKLESRDPNPSDPDDNPWKIINVGGVDVHHMGDPTVTKSKDGIYTMFFTLCKDNNGQCIEDALAEVNYNSIWSVTSVDGIHWDNARLLLSNDKVDEEQGRPNAGPAEPYAIQTDDGRWNVYYSNRVGNANHINMVRVNKDRRAVGIFDVYHHDEATPIVAPEVHKINGKWQLFYNVHRGVGNTRRTDIYRLESDYEEITDDPAHNTDGNPEEESSEEEDDGLVVHNWSYEDRVYVIENPDEATLDTVGDPCATSTPAIIPRDGMNYDLFFGQAYFGFIDNDDKTVDNIDCINTRHDSINRWEMKFFEPSVNTTAILTEEGALQFYAPEGDLLDSVDNVDTDTILKALPSLARNEESTIVADFYGTGAPVELKTSLTSNVITLDGKTINTFGSQVDEENVKKDVLLTPHYLFGGYNIYGPTVFFDPVEVKYKMWYMGWESAGQTNDAIYYRESTDEGKTWSEPEPVLTPQGLKDDVTDFYNSFYQSRDINIDVNGISHVGDPTITKHPQTGSYTMFFTLCKNGCIEPI